MRRTIGEKERGVLKGIEQRMLRQGILILIINKIEGESNFTERRFNRKELVSTMKLILRACY